MTRAGSGRSLRHRVVALSIASVVLVSWVFVAGPAGARGSPDPASLPEVASGHRPGPDVLYEPPADAPQLDNRPGLGWKAPPLLVSGASAYVSGEYLYQGYLYDDHGGQGMVDPNDPYLTNFAFAAKTGTLTYPTDPVFADNAADIIELRLRPTPDATALRLTFNTLIDPSRTAFTVAIGSSAAAVPWPDEAGVSSPAEMFLTVHGDQAELTRAVTGQALSPAPSVTVDLARRQFDILIPRQAWDPGSSTVRFAAGAGLWDVAAGHYLLPGAVATATSPGGMSPSREALFDMAFRSSEPDPDWNVMGRSTTLADAAVMEQADQHCFWRDCQQGASLRVGDASPFHADIDFAELEQHVTDMSQVPVSGSIDRIFASHVAFGQGVDVSSACGRFPASCKGMFLGDLQPYNVYVPDTAAPPSGWPITVDLHASGANYNEYMGSRDQTELGQRGRGSIVVTPLARDPNGDYTDASEVDVFEAWADAARHYPLDPSGSVLAGYSMGGGGTYKLAERWPDLFAAAFAAAAVPYDHGFQGQWMSSLRNVPLMTWVSTGDEGSPLLYQREQIDALESYGLRFRFDQFLEGDHVTLATNDQFAPVANWLGGTKVADDPFHISFAVDPNNDFAKEGVVADHAYWLSGLELRSSTAAPTGASQEVISEVDGGIDPGASAEGPYGQIDAVSRGFGLADSQPSASSGVGVLYGGHHGPMPYVETDESWTATRRIAMEDRLSIQVTNIADVTVDLSRAHLTCATTVQVQSDGPVAVHFPACGRTLDFGAGTSARRISAS